MADEKSKRQTGRREGTEKPSEGQYGGLKNLGPGGGRDIEEADLSLDEADKKRPAPPRKP